ncbi:MAG: TetR/AcrR family transcriptional regulator [Spirochaetia bacterium]|nr:TetR/AcrR family transcriptional regulator [Spirochaetia bacterium]
MSSEGASPRERILATAARLFSTHGYPNTGVNLIVAEASAARASFYDYFPSKEALGVAYLRSYGEEHLNWLKTLMKRHPKPHDFVRAWTMILKRQSRQGMTGCPMANLLAQVADTAPTLTSDVQSIATRTIVTLTEYLDEAQRAGHWKSKMPPASTARQLFAAYEGVLQIWRLTGKASALDDLFEMGGCILDRS